MQWGVPALIVFGSAAVVVLALVFTVRGMRRGKRARAKAQQALADLGALLVQLDDATEELELEIGMSSALYDGRPPASLRRARLTAQHTRDDAFAAYSAATAEGVLPAHQRAESQRLTVAVQKALDVIGRAHADNEAWLAENSTAAEQVAVARRRFDELAERMGDPAALRAELARIADESEWEDAAHADEDAREALEQARQHLEAAEATAKDPSASARAELTACEKSLAHAEQASQMLEETHRLVEHAALAIADEQKGAAAAIRAAAGTQLAMDPEHAPKLAEAIRVASVALDSAMQIAPRRPVAATERIARLRDRLDIALADARTQQQRLRNAIAHHHRADPELLHQAAAVPARRQGGDHDRVAVGALAAGLAEGVGLAVHGGVVFLHPAVVAAAEQAAILMVERRADRDSTLRQALAGFGNRGVEQGAVVGRGNHDEQVRMRRACESACLFGRGRGRDAGNRR